MTTSGRCGVAMAFERRFKDYGASDKILYVVSGAGADPDLAVSNAAEYCRDVLQEGRACEFLKPLAAACNEW